MSWTRRESPAGCGPVGVGKTHVAQALGNLAVRQGAHVRFAKTSRILAYRPSKRPRNTAYKAH